MVSGTGFLKKKRALVCKQAAARTRAEQRLEREVQFAVERIHTLREQFGGTTFVKGRHQSPFGAKLALCAGAYRPTVVKTIVSDVLEGFVMAKAGGSFITKSSHLQITIPLL